MQVPLQITYRGMASSDALSHDIREEVQNLERFFDRITGCHVVVEQPHRHHQKGRHFRVQVDLRIPGEEIVVGRDPKEHESHEDAHVAVREVFGVVRRQLQEAVQRMRSEVKRHSSLPAVAEEA